MADRTVTVRLRAATGDYVAAMGAAGRSTKDLRQELGHLDDASAQGGRGMSRLGGLASGAAGGLAALVGSQTVSAIVQFGTESVTAFASVEDATAALTSTYGQTGQAMIDWAQQSGDALNLSQQDALAAVQTFANFGSSAGLAGKELGDFATTMAARAADMASYFGGSTADAIEAVGAALRGESEPILRYGVLLDDTTLKARALTMGLIESTTQALTPQQRVLAAQAEVLAQTSKAQGDVARTADSMGNTIKDAQQKWVDFQVEAGKALAPTVAEGLKSISDGLAAVKPLLPSIISGFTALSEASGKLGGTLNALHLPDWLANNDFGKFLATYLGGGGGPIGTAAAGIGLFNQRQDEASAKADAMNTALRQLDGTWDQTTQTWTVGAEALAVLNAHASEWDGTLAGLVALMQKYNPQALKSADAASGAATGLAGLGNAITGAFAGASAAVNAVLPGLQAEHDALKTIEDIDFEASIAGLPKLEQAQARLARAQEALAATTPGTKEHAAALIEVARQEAAVGAAADAMAADQAAAADDTRKAIKAMKGEIAGIEFERGLIGMSELDAANARLARLKGELQDLKPGTQAYRDKLVEIAQATNDSAQASYDLTQTLADLDYQIAGVRFERSLIGLGDVEAERKRLQRLRKELSALVPGTEAYKRKLLEVEQQVNRVTEAERRQSEERAAERQRQAEENAADRQRQIDEATSLRDQLRQLLPEGFAASLLESTPQQINDVLGGLVDGVRAALSGSVERDLVALISSTNEQLAGLATQRAAVVEQLATAESSLTDLRNQREQMVSGLSQAAAGNIMQAGTSARGLSRWMTRRLDTIQRFAADITALQARGLPQWLLRQIVDAAIGGDLDGAAAMAKGLVAMPDADFTQLVTVAGQVQTAAGQLGQTAGSIMFDEGIAIAQALVDGLTAQKTQLEAQMTALGEALRKAIEDALTRTPITVDVNGRVTLVYPDGQEARPAPATGRASGGAVARGRTYLVGEAGPELLTMPASGYVTRAGDVPRTIAAAAAAAQPPRGLSIGSITVQAPPGQRVDRVLPTTLREAAYLMGAS